MRILVHDYAGHSFQVQLSRALAARGHEVRHIYARFSRTPKGLLTQVDSDPSNFDIVGLELGGEFAKHSVVKRVRQEMTYGRMMAREIERMRPEVVISSNMPLDPQASLARACRYQHAAFVFWLQDIYSLSIDRGMRKWLPVVGAAVGARYLRLEKRLLREADAVVTITADVLPTLDRWGVARERIEVVENWAPLRDIPQRPRDNPWRAAHGLDDKLVLLYSGTLGSKHDPGLLLALAHRLSSRPDARVVVISEGPGADWLATHKSSLPTDNLILLPFQPFTAMPDMLGAADVLTAVLEPEAGTFSVPSKISTYLCAGRAVLAAMPAENLAARTLTRAGAGLVTSPDDEGAFCDAGDRLAGDSALRERLGAAGRAHAETHFRIDRIADRFERLCEKFKAGYV